MCELCLMRWASMGDGDSGLKSTEDYVAFNEQRIKSLGMNGG